jgi:hypothetical protein
MFVSQYLGSPMVVFGHKVTTCEDAAYRVRQHVIEHYDDGGRKLVRSLREARTMDEAFHAEDTLRRWLFRQKPSPLAFDA